MLTNLINVLARDYTAVEARAFEISEIVIAVLLTVCSLFMIVAVIMQKGESNGNQLPLTLGYISSFFVDLCFIAIG